MKTLIVLVALILGAPVQAFAPILCIMEGEVQQDVLPPYDLSDDPFPNVVVPVIAHAVSNSDMAACDMMDGQLIDYVFREDELPLRQGQRVPVVVMFSATDFLSGQDRN